MDGPTRVSSTDFSKEVGRYQDLALTRAVIVTRNGRDRTVVISADEYGRLQRASGRTGDIAPRFNSSDSKPTQNPAAAVDAATRRAAAGFQCHRTQRETDHGAARRGGAGDGGGEHAEPAAVGSEPAGDHFRRQHGGEGSAGEDVVAGPCGRGSQPRKNTRVTSKNVGSSTAQDQAM